MISEIMVKKLRRHFFVKNWMNYLTEFDLQIDILSVLNMFRAKFFFNVIIIYSFRVFHISVS